MVSGGTCLICHDPSAPQPQQSQGSRHRTQSTPPTLLGVMAGEALKLALGIKDAQAGPWAPPRCRSKERTCSSHRSLTELQSQQARWSGRRAINPAHAPWRDDWHGVEARAQHLRCSSQAAGASGPPERSHTQNRLKSVIRWRARAAHRRLKRKGHATWPGRREHPRQK